MTKVKIYDENGDKMDLKSFCIDNNLGNVKQISKLFGGLMHKMFKVETDKETYAIKVLNQEVMSRSDAYHNFVRSETISNLAKNNEIAVSSALLIKGKYLIKYNNMYYMVFDFINGKVLKDEDITINHCKKIGKILSQIHSLDYNSLGLENKKINYKNLYDWESYIKNSNFDDMSYKEEYLRNYKKYNSLLKRSNERYNDSNIEISICHSDMDPKNVMWDGLNPTIIDWESAELSNPDRELLDVALRWSGFLSRNFDEEKFAAVIIEYMKIKPINHLNYSTICGNLVGSFWWLKYNLERSLGICSDDQEEKKLAENEVRITIDEINYYITLIGKMYEIISKLTKINNHDYHDIIKKVIDHNIILNNQEYELITTGFTNTIYKVGDYVVRICTDLSNENNFENEIEFYKNHKDHPYIPKMYYFDTKKDIIPYYYEILERVEGKTLYEVWHELSQSERNNIVKNMIEIIKSFHHTEVTYIDFKKYIKDKISDLLKENKIDEEIFKALLEKCDIYFKENKLGLLHRDLHFDNLISNNENLILIDFERNGIGAIDYDFRILSRYKETPWLWASEKTDMLAVESDYQDLMDLIMNNYEELRSIPYLFERLKVYEIIDLLNDYKKCKDESKLEEVREKVKILLTMKG